MADNINITSGSGLVIKTDDVGGVHYQQIKLVDGNLESTSPTGVKNNPFIVSVQNTGAVQSISGGITILSSSQILVSTGVIEVSGSTTALVTGTVTIVPSGSQTITGGTTILSSIYLPVNIGIFTAGTVSLLNTATPGLVTGTVTIVPSGTQAISGGTTILSSTYLDVRVFSNTGGTVSLLNTATPGLVTGTVTAVLSNTGPYNVVVLGTSAPAQMSGGVSILSSIYLDVNINTFTAGTVSLLNTATPGLVTGTVTIVPSGTQTISGGVSILSAGSLSVNATVLGVPTVDLNKVAGDTVQVDNGTAAKSIRVTIANDSTGVITVLNTRTTATVSGTVTTVPSGTQAISGGSTILSSTYLDVRVFSNTGGTVSLLNTSTPGFITGGVSILSMPAVTLSGGVSILSSTYLNVNVNTFTAGTVSLLNTATPGFITGGVTLLSATTIFVSSGPWKVESEISGGVTILSSCYVMVTSAPWAVESEVSGSVTILSSTYLDVRVFSNTGGTVSVLNTPATQYVATQTNAVVFVSSSATGVVLVSAASLTGKFQVTGGVSLLSGSITATTSGGFSILSSTYLDVRVFSNTGGTVSILNSAFTVSVISAGTTIVTTGAGKVQVSGQVSAIISGGVSLLSWGSTFVTGGVSLLSWGSVFVTGGVSLLSSTILNVNQGSAAYSVLGFTPTWIYAALSSNNQTVVWKPGAAKKFVMTDLTINAAYAGLVTVTQDTAATVTIAKFTFGNNGGYAGNFTTPWTATQTNHGLVITSTVQGTNTYVSVSGYESA